MLAQTVRRLQIARPRAWFVDPEPVSRVLWERPSVPSPPPAPPDNAPQALKMLHSVLSESPILEQSALDVFRPESFPPGPPLPVSMAKGRRRRGGTYAGEGILADSVGGIWNWFLLAQVTHGAENRGAIEAVERLVRTTLRSMQPPVSIPRTPKRRLHEGWAMVDAGDFAVHILSRNVRERYFVSQEW